MSIAQLLTCTLLAWSGPEGRSREACSVAVTSPNVSMAVTQKAKSIGITAGPCMPIGNVYIQRKVNTGLLSICVNT